MTDGVRVDKWLWAVRIYKTRNQAGEACRSGKIKINDIPVKPSREIKIGDILRINLGVLTKTVKITGLLQNRVAAKFVSDFLVDMTPAEEYAKIELLKERKFEFRLKGLGRPTKKERRIIDRLKKH